MSDNSALGLRIWVIYTDPDLLEIAAVACNGRFFGRCEAYTTRESLEELRASLRHFPANRSDVREFELGTFDPLQAGGGLKVVLEQSDYAGHCSARVTLRSPEPPPVESVVLHFSFEPAAIDTFVSELAVLTVEEPDRGRPAHLRATG